MLRDAVVVVGQRGLPRAVNLFSVRHGPACDNQVHPIMARSSVVAACLALVLCDTRCVSLPSSGVMSSCKILSGSVQRGTALVLRGAPSAWRVLAGMRGGGEDEEW